jgi:cullin-associated NEDD8-dissociated protein 1
MIDRWMQVSAHSLLLSVSFFKLCYTSVTFVTFLQDCLLDFLMLMEDPDRHVRKAAVVALSAVVHHKPGLVAAGLEQLLPQLYDQTVIKPEMVRASVMLQSPWLHHC